jgi:hypothetical protein
MQEKLPVMKRGMSRASGDLAAPWQSETLALSYITIATKAIADTTIPLIIRDRDRPCDECRCIELFHHEVRAGHAHCTISTYHLPLFCCLARLPSFSSLVWREPVVKNRPELLFEDGGSIRPLILVIVWSSI